VRTHRLDAAEALWYKLCGIGKEREMTGYKVDWEQLPWEHPADGVRHKIYREGGRRLRLVEFGKGFVETDWCTRGHIGYVLEGELELEFRDPCTAGLQACPPNRGAPGPQTRVRFSAGDGVFIPAGQEHGHKATVLSDVVRLVLVEEA
jgi:hypothetical protein